MKAEQVKITSIEQLKQMLETAKCGGQWVSVRVKKECKMNVFPTDGSEKVRRDLNFVAYDSYSVESHYSQDYCKAMAKALGLASYEAHDSNRRHIVPNVLMQYVSTGNICYVCLPTEYLNYKTVNANGEPLSESELAYYNRYKTPKSKDGDIPYRTIGIANIVSIAMGNKVYVLEIPKDTYLTQKEKVATAA